ncbi:MAG: hypothetical protein V1755_00620 [Chloroflexota bacterium]
MNHPRQVAPRKYIEPRVGRNGRTYTHRYAIRAQLDRVQVEWLEIEAARRGVAISGLIRALVEAARTIQQSNANGG